MNTILGILLTWTIFGTLYEAQCTDIPLEIDMEDLRNGCKDRHYIVHELNSSWVTFSCEVCRCSRKGIECSSIIVRPIGYDKEKCKEVFNAADCSYKPIKKEYPFKNCDFSHYIV